MTPFTLANTKALSGCPPSLDCRVRAIEIWLQQWTENAMHPPALLTWGAPGQGFFWNIDSQRGNVPIYVHWPFEAVAPHDPVELTLDPIYLGHALLPIRITDGIRISSAYPGTSGLKVQIFINGAAAFPFPVELTSGTTLFPVTALNASAKSIPGGSRLEIIATEIPPGYGQWHGLNVGFMGEIDPQGAVSGNPPVNLVIPTISGITLAPGFLLQSVPGTWANNPTAFQYQWYIAGVPVATGGTGTSLTIPAGTEGKPIQLKVTASNEWGSTPAWSNTITIPSPVILPVNTTPPALSSVSGGTTAGTALLQTTNGTWSGTAPFTYSYKWFRDGVQIVGQAFSTYQTVASDAGKVIYATVTATNAAGSSLPAQTNSIAISGAAPSIPVLTAPPVVGGDSTVGTGLLTMQTPTGSVGTWSNSPTSYQYQWWRITGGVASIITGATAIDYTPIAADAGKQVYATVTAVNAGGPSAPAASNTVLVSSGSGISSTVYWGRSTNPTLTGSQVAALGNSLSTTTAAGTYNIPAGAGYYYIAIPETLNAPASLKLASSLFDLVLITTAPYTNTTNGLNFASTPVYSQNYRVYRSFNTLGGADGIVAANPIT